MPVGWLDAVTDTTIWGRVAEEGVAGPVGLRVEVDGRLWGYGRAGHVDPEGGPWRFAIAHGLEPGRLVSVYATGTGDEPVLLDGSPRAVLAGTPPRGELEAVTATKVVGWATDDDYEGPITVALYVDGRFWRRVTADLARPDLEEQGPGGTVSPSTTPWSRDSGSRRGRSGCARTAPATGRRCCCLARR